MAQSKMYISLTYPYNGTSYRTLHNRIETIFLRHVFEDGVSYDSLLKIVYGKCSIQTAWNIFDLYLRPFELCRKISFVSRTFECLF